MNTRKDIKRSSSWQAYEFSIVRVRSISVAQSLVLCDSPEKAFAYWKEHVGSTRGLNQDCEHIVVLLLDARNRIRGHQLAGTGTVDSVLLHPREIFRAAVISAASGIVLTHNHPSGDSAPSESDLRTTREIARASKILRIGFLDHIIIGDSDFTSLKALGFTDA